jgi:FAD/FMN-containing dehydrogenase
MENFGANQVFEPAQVFQPRCEEEVVRILKEHRGSPIRAVGSLHSWSEVCRVEGILLDMRFFDRVELIENGGEPRAIVGAGCRIERALEELNKRGYTLPALGLISEQTIAGAAATATHGSGRHSISYFIVSARLACYDPATGEPVVRDVSSGDELRAVQTSLGCLGIVLSLELRVRPQYRIEEWFSLRPKLDEMLEAEAETPLQQFYYLPWLDKYLGQHRRETEQPRGRLARLYRIYWFLFIDLGLHLVLCFLVRWLRSRAAVKLFYRWGVVATVIRGWRVVDQSQRMLIMEHELFRHIEIELFVTRPHLPAAMETVREAIAAFDGGGQGQQYTHHYPICIRRVLPDEALLSMSSQGADDYYAISIISYARPNERHGFFAFAAHLASRLSTEFSARCHWGKVCPLSPSDIERLYPQLARFREIQRQCDPRGVFANEWTRRMLGL